MSEPAALGDSCLEGALQQAGRPHALRILRKGAGRAPPPQLVHLAEKLRVGPKRRQILEQERQTAAVYLKQLAGAGVLQEVKVGREKLFINPRLMRLLTVEKPGVLSFRTRQPGVGR